MKRFKKRRQQSKYHLFILSINLCSVVSVGTIRSTKSYVVKLESQLRAEIERRTKLEQEI